MQDQRQGLVEFRNDGRIRRKESPQSKGARVERLVQFGQSGLCNFEKASQFLRTQIVSPQFGDIRGANPIELGQRVSLSSVQVFLGKGAAQAARIVKVKTGVTAEINGPGSVAAPPGRNGLRVSGDFQFGPFHEGRGFPKQIFPVLFPTRHGVSGVELHEGRREF